MFRKLKISLYNLSENVCVDELVYYKTNGAKTRTNNSTQWKQYEIRKKNRQCSKTRIKIGVTYLIKAMVVKSQSNYLRNKRNKEYRCF